MIRALATLLLSIPTAAPPEAHVWHLVVPDDLDSTDQADRLVAELAAAEESRPRLLLLELAGDSGRWDLVARVAQQVSGMTLPVTVFLDDPRDRRVGVAQLVIALASRGGVIGEGTHVRSSLAWVHPDEGGRWRLSRERPGPESAGRAIQVVFLEDRDTWVFRASPRLLADLSLPIESARSSRDLRRRLGVLGLSTRRVELASGLGEARARAERVLADADRLIEDLRARLSLPADHSVAADTIRRRGRSIVSDAQAALDALTEVEDSLRRFPELLREPAPGQTVVAGSPSSYAAGWRRALQSRQDRLRRQQDEGRVLAER